MKDDFSQDEMIPSNNNLSSINDDSLDWAKQAYLQLKQKQREEKELRQKEINEKDLLESKKNIKDDIKLNVLVQNKSQASKDSKEEDE